MSSIAHIAAGAARSLVDAVLPPQCLACDALVAAPGSLCAACWQAADFIAPPFCTRCGIPFEFDAGSGALCGACAAQEPDYDRARAVLRYDDVARRLVIAFKHGDRCEGAPAFGRWLARAGGELIAQADLIVPVPLHRNRLWRRRYNQSALLAQGLVRALGRGAPPLVPDLLVRRRATPSQGGLSADQRRRNVRGAFAVQRGQEARVGGKRILLIDDVMTTGATVAACASALEHAGVAAVDVLTLARVARPGRAA